MRPGWMAPPDGLYETVMKLPARSSTRATAYVITVPATAYFVAVTSESGVDPYVKMRPSGVYWRHVPGPPNAKNVNTEPSSWNLRSASTLSLLRSNGSPSAHHESPQLNRLGAALAPFCRRFTHREICDSPASVPPPPATPLPPPLV